MNPLPLRLRRAWRILRVIGEWMRDWMRFIWQQAGYFEPEEIKTRPDRGEP